MNFIDRSAVYLAQSIRKHNPEAGSEAVLKYALSLFINTSSAIFVSLVICSFTGKLAYAVLSIISFLILRYVSGGVHLSSSLSCCICSIMLITLAAHSSFSYAHLGFIMNCCAWVILLKTAPNGIQGYSRIDAKYYPVLKFVSLAIVSSNFFFQSSVLSTVFFSQAMLTIPLAYWVRNYVERWGRK